MNTITNTPVTVPAISTEITDLMDDLTGFHPALDRAVAALGDLLTSDLSVDQSQSLVAALAGLADGSFTTLVAHAVRSIANPDTNESLRQLSNRSKQDLRRLGAEYVAQADADLRDTASEISAVIDGS
jgi:hypothetical protein